MTDSTMTALIGAGGAILAAALAVVMKRALDGRRKSEPTVRTGSGSAGLATSGRGGTSVATSANGGHAISVVGSPGATVVVPAPDAKRMAERDPGDSRVFVRETTPHEIRRVLLAAPPLQREGLKQSAFIGRWVRWTGEVFNVAHARKYTTPPLESEPPAYNVAVTVGPPGFGRVVSVELPESARPIVELLREGDIVEVEGRLDQLDDIVSALSGATILRHAKPQG